MAEGMGSIGRDVRAASEDRSSAADLDGGLCFGPHDLSIIQWAIDARRSVVTR